MVETVKVGDKAPDFDLEAQNGHNIALHDFIGSKNVVLYFYPKDFTPGCRAETKSFSENYDALLALGAEVLGISSDSADSHVDFARECGATFPMLADRGGRVRESYGVKSSLGLTPGRVTFVIDKSGIVRHVFSSQLRPKQHVTEALEALKALHS
ncbi:MAG TPA: peroxiredoxin [Nitrososphaerales archaeon]|nr:peroxiredoxin [Nitrososphaerales archaeon]